MNGCNTFIFDSLPEKELIPRFEISSFHWEKDGYSRPESSVRFCAVKNEGYYAFLESSESPVLARYTRRDDPVYTDSCLEVFIAPVSGRSEYINFEMNPNGAYLSQFGSERTDRRVPARQCRSLHGQKGLACSAVHPGRADIVALRLRVFGQGGQDSRQLL